MTFDQIVDRIARRLNLTSSTATTRIGESVNERYKEIMSTLGLENSARGTVTATATVGSRSLAFDATKVYAVIDFQSQALTSLTSVSTTATATLVDHGYSTGANITISGATPSAYNGNYTITVTSSSTFTYVFAGGSSPATGTILVSLQQPRRILEELTFDEMRNRALMTSTPEAWAVEDSGATTTTIMLDCIPTTAFRLTADGMVVLSELSGSQVPAFSENFHDILILGGKATELDKMEKPQLALKEEKKYEKRLAELRYHYAASAYLQIYQNKGSRNRFVRRAY